jgi:hypothetical protein
VPPQRRIDLLDRQHVLPRIGEHSDEVLRELIRR